MSALDLITIAMLLDRHQLLLGTEEKTRVSGRLQRNHTEGFFFSFLLKVHLLSTPPLSLKCYQHLVNR